MAWIAGIVIGPLLAIALLGFLVWFCVKRRKRQRPNQNDSRVGKQIHEVSATEIHEVDGHRTHELSSNQVYEVGEGLPRGEMDAAPWDGRAHELAATPDGRSGGHIRV